MTFSTRPSSCHVTGASQRGFTLVEVLIAVLVLAIGLLGLAGLQASSLRFNNDAQLRSQATMLAYDISDRMRANSTAASNGAYDLALTAGACGAGAGGGSVAAQDLAQWLAQLGCLLPQGAGQVQRLADDIVAVEIRWNERADGDPDFVQTFEFRTRVW
jgi:type IV pilus assembly protein PilV